jgi:hypothetical protein
LVRVTLTGDSTTIGSPVWATGIGWLKSRSFDLTPKVAREMKNRALRGFVLGIFSRNENGKDVEKKPPPLLESGGFRF